MERTSTTGSTSNHEDLFRVATLTGGRYFRHNADKLKEIYEIDAWKKRNSMC